MLPNKIQAGVTLDIPITLTEYPAPDWTLTVIMRGPGSIDLAAAQDENQHVLTETAIETQSWQPGDYWYAVRVTDGTDVIQLDEGTVTVSADLAQASEGFDGRSHAERTLEAIEAVIEKRASIDQLRYKINNRELERMQPSDLFRFRDYYKNLVNRERMAKKGQSLLGRKVLVRF